MSQSCTEQEVDPVVTEIVRNGVLAVSDFTKDLHVVTADRSALASLGPHVVALAEAEGLDAHAESVRRRLAAIEEDDDA